MHACYYRYSTRSRLSTYGRILQDVRRTSDALLISRYQMPSDIRLIDLHYKI